MGRQGNPNSFEGASPPSRKVKGLLRHLPQNIRDLGRFIRNPGRLPVELWYIVTDNLSDIETLLSLRLTCKMLSCLAKQILLSLTGLHPLVVEKPIDLTRVRHQMRRKPSAASFVCICRVSRELLVRFLCRWAGRFPNGRVFHVVDDTSAPTCLPLLRNRILSLAVCFGDLTELRLSSCSFRSFHEFLRPICAFPNVHMLSLLNCRWIRGSEGPEQYIQLTKGLHLKDLKIRDSEVSNYRPLLALHALRNSIVSINIQGNSMPRRRNTDLIYQAPERVTSLEFPSSAPASLWRSQSASILIAVDNEQEFGTPWIYECSDMLDSFVDESIAACVIEVDVRCGYDQYQDLPTLSDGSLVLPRLRARGTLRVLVDESLEHSPVLGYQRCIKFC
ncbi:hypothetical protein CERSUDRAFT_120135 [Gelatoporia subvermispora B]|uniref:F-box domain-containing protein n=1 Tax=Ceriporiopsis subvermispora (strain B) TaxID=914234 RepID=M2Q2Q5_CERS8|nr:hypothetical protein CERSUDRAFT_120135 [Gelatoporia subvermispora B]